MASLQEFEAVVIGGGQGGALARYLAVGGLKTALIEEKWVGGTCVNYGCTPSKTLISSARTAYLAKRGSDFGLKIGDVSTDWNRVRLRAERIVTEFRDEISQRLEATPNLTWIHGTASFTGEDTLAVVPNSEGETPYLIRSPRIVIATGGTTSLPHIDGMEKVDCLTAENLLQLKELPRHVLIVGGGYIGVEYGQMLRRLGSQVTLVQADAQLLGREDRDVADALQKILEEDGLRVFLNTKVTRFKNVKNEISAALETQDESKPGTSRVGNQSVTDAKRVTVSHVLLATGRQPNTARLTLENAGIELTKSGFVKVNNRLCTNRKHVWAMGDVAGSPPFTHVAFDDARQLRDYFLRGTRVSTSDRLFSYVVFTDPQLGRVGLSETEAREKGYCIRVAHLPVCDTARGLESGDTRGFLKAIVDNKTNCVLGGAFLAVEGGELIATLQMAMRAKLPYTALRDAVIAHPTMAESLNRLFIGLETQPKIGKEC